MTIQRVWNLGLSSMPLAASGYPMLTSADAAALDAATCSALDKSIDGDVLFGPLSIFGTGAVLSLDSPTSQYLSGAGGITTASGGRVRCGNNDFPDLNGNPSLTHFVSFSEVFCNLAAYVPPGLFPIATTPSFKWYFDSQTTGTVWAGTYQGLGANTGGFIPITRMHDGAVVTEVDVYFTVNAGRTSLPARFPAINLYQFDPFLNVVTSMTNGWVYFTNGGVPPPNLTTYKNGGVPNELVATMTPFTVDVSRFVYFLGVLEEDYGADAATPSVPNEFHGFGVVLTTGTLRFQ